jgi:glutamate synthase (NADPH/NADH) small chain
MPASAEEVHHAKQEGIEFKILTNPVKIISDDRGQVQKLECVRTQLTEPDEKGRRKARTIEGSNFLIDVDSVIMAIGTSPNPLIKDTTPSLEVNSRGGIVASEHGATSKAGVFAGGDAVTGSATVILAMGAGKASAQAIDEYIKNKNK